MPPTMQDFAVASTQVRYNRGSRMIYAYQSRPRDMGFYPGVLVLHDILGLTDTYRAWTRTLAARDFFAKAPDLYSRAETPKPDKLKALADQLKWFAALPDQRVLDDLERTWEVLERLHWVANQPLGILGFGMGAYYALLHAAANPQVKLVVAVNPRYVFEQEPPKKKTEVDLKPRKLDGVLANLKARVAVVLPTGDEYLTAENAQRFLDSLDRQSVTYTHVPFQGAGAGFWVAGSEQHSPAMAKELERLVLLLLEEHLR